MSAIVVAVGIVRDAKRRVLIAQRHASQHQGGKWEFPGGKVELGESSEQALVRELQEEVAIHVETCQSFMQLDHDYGDKQVRLAVYQVTEFSGQACGNEQQAIQWVAPAQLIEFDMPMANQPIVAALLREV